MTTRTLQYNITIIIPETNDLEAIATTFEQYLKDFKAATNQEYPETQIYSLHFPDGTPHHLDI